MAIDAIVSNMDTVWVNTEEAKQTAKIEQRAALKRFLESVRDDGYPLLLVSELNAASLNDAISDTLGDDGIMYFSSIVSSSACDSRYAVVLHTLGTSAHRILAVGADERVLEEARNSGITQCLPLSDALHRGWKPFSLASAPDSRGDS